MHPPPSPARANFTLMIECTPESNCYYSVYSVTLASWTHTEHKKIAGRGDFQGWCNINISKLNHTVKRQIEHLFDSAANK